MELLLTPQEAAQILRIKLRTLYTWAYRRQIPSQRVGKALRLRREEIEKWLNAQARTVWGLGGQASTIQQCCWSVCQASIA